MWKYKKYQGVLPREQSTLNINLDVNSFCYCYGVGSYIGAISLIYKKGLLYGAPLLFGFINWLIMSYIFSHDLSRFRKFISLPEIMSFLYGKFAGNISSVMIIINAIGTVSL